MVDWAGRSLSLLLVLVAGCAATIDRGRDLYSSGRHIEAAEFFERTEHRLPEYSAVERARYGLYRGLNLLLLGDEYNARRWLAYSSDIERRTPGTLDEQARTLLERGSADSLRQSAIAEPEPTSPALTANRQPAPVGPAAPESPDSLEERRSLAP